jgi:hypothetical protein
MAADAAAIRRENPHETDLNPCKNRAAAKRLKVSKSLASSHAACNSPFAKPKGET